MSKSEQPPRASYPAPAEGQLNSAIYEGSVRHRRNLPKVHQFDFRFFMLLLDLEEVDQVFAGRWFWSNKRWALCRFQSRDHLKNYLDPNQPDQTLRERVLNVLAERGIEQPIGPIRLLTQLSYLGYSMNPVSFFYCYDSTGESIEAILVEVNNTPWGEQHVYAIPGNSLDFPATIRSGDIKKDFHVSPFMTLDMNYRMAFSPPAENLAVKIENHSLPDVPTAPREGELQDHAARSEAQRSPSRSERKQKRNKLIDVTMSLKRRPITTSSLAWLLIKYPAISFQVVAGIYWQALRLYLKKIPFVPHPEKKKSSLPAVVD